MSNKTKHKPAAATPPSDAKIDDAEVVGVTASTALVPADAGAASQAVALPPMSALESTDGEAAAENGYRSVPYVGFRGAKAKTKLEQLDAAGVKVLDFYLYDNEVVKVGPPFECHVLNVWRSYCKNNTKMELVGASLVFSEKLKNDDYKETLDALVLVIARGKDGPSYVPALMNLRGAHAKALKLPKELLETAKDAAAWGKRSAQHAASAGASLAGGRFVATLWTTEEEVKDDSGLSYNLGHSVTTPTKPADVEAFNAFVKDGWETKIAPVFQAYQRRTAFKRKLAEKLGNV